MFFLKFVMALICCHNYIFYPLFGTIYVSFIIIIIIILLLLLLFVLLLLLLLFAFYFFHAFFPWDVQNYSGASEKRTLWGIKLCPFLRGRPDLGDFLIIIMIHTENETFNRSFNLCWTLIV